MVDKSNMSIQEILAAARKADGGEASPPAEPKSSQPEEAPEQEASSAPAETPATSKPVAKPGSAGRPSVSDILAMARGKGAASDKPAAKPASKPVAKPAAEAKAKPAPKPAAAKKAEPLDTQSILAAARKAKQPGPMSKAEAAAKAKPAAPTAKKPKEKIVVPPVPEKPAYAVKGAKAPADAEAASRRSFLFGLSALATGFAALSITGVAWTLGTIRFMFPNVLREPPSKFKVGFPDQFPPGQVETKFKAQFGVWIVNTSVFGEQEIFALKSVCTHLGCTPNWLEAEQKFKCPCHGSGFYKDGINFEGPAPRPLERYAIAMSDDGQLEVDKSQIFQEEMGQWSDPASYVPA